VLEDYYYYTAWIIRAPSTGPAPVLCPSPARRPSYGSGGLRGSACVGANDRPPTRAGSRITARPRPPGRPPSTSSYPTRTRASTSHDTKTGQTGEDRAFNLAAAGVPEQVLHSTRPRDLDENGREVTHSEDVKVQAGSDATVDFSGRAQDARQVIDQSGLGNTHHKTRDRACDGTSVRRPRNPGLSRRIPPFSPPFHSRRGEYEYECGKGPAIWRSLCSACRLVIGTTVARISFSIKEERPRPLMTVRRRWADPEHLLQKNRVPGRRRPAPRPAVWSCSSARTWWCWPQLARSAGVARARWKLPDVVGQERSWASRGLTSRSFRGTTTNEFLFWLAAAIVAYARSGQPGAAITSGNPAPRRVRLERQPRVEAGTVLTAPGTRNPGLPSRVPAQSSTPSPASSRCCWPRRLGVGCRPSRPLTADPGATWKPLSFPEVGRGAPRAAPSSSVQETVARAPCGSAAACWRERAL